MKSPRPASDWPRQLDDCDDTLPFVRTRFFGTPVPPLSADASLDALLCERTSTVRAKLAEAPTLAEATLPLPSIARSTAELAGDVANDVDTLSRRSA
jgi:hypothetical protein